MYFSTPEKYYSWQYAPGDRGFWRHNVLGNYQNYYGVREPFILEFVSNSTPLTKRIWDSAKLLTTARRYDTNLKEFREENLITFNKALFYNSRQISGELNLIVKDDNGDPLDYLNQQVDSPGEGSVIIDRNEEDWGINYLRDIRVDHTVPMFSRDPDDLQTDYFIDKIVNPVAIDFAKSWEQLESFRDEYLVNRYIFDNFDDVKLLFNYSIENENISNR